MATSSFGEHLKREREMRGVSLQEIASATRISTRFLDALENEQWDRLPGGIFNRGFVRAVAHFLGLDEENLLAEYALATNDQPQVAVWADKEPVKPRGRYKAGVALALLLVAAGVVTWSNLRSPWLTGILGSPVVSAPAAAPQAAPQPAAASDAAAAAMAAETLELKIDAGRETQLTVIADGKKEFDGRLAPREQRRYQAKEGFDLSASDLNALVLELNGQLLPPLGQKGEPGQTRLTREDLKKLRGGPH